jgi:hypothetical protein
MNKRIKKRFDIEVSSADSNVSKSFELDKDVVFIIGMLITSDKDDLLYYRGSQRIEINKEEIFPEKYESKLLQSGINVSPNNRFYDLGKIPPGNGIIKVDYKDTPHSIAVFTPYRVSFYIECETSG